jgi:hypothetical protein
MRRTKPATVKDMARRRGLWISKATHGGWYVTLHGYSKPSPVLYASHSWDKIKTFIKRQPIMVLRQEDVDE